MSDKDSEQSNSEPSNPEELKDLSKNAHRRVKLYSCGDDKTWTDCGTGLVTCQYFENLGGVGIEVREENDDEVLMIQTKICPETVYNVQQETLIVWTESEKVELALSFQEKEGCNDVWMKISNAQGLQGKHHSYAMGSEDIDMEVQDATQSAGAPATVAVEITADQFEDIPPMPIVPLELPACELSKLDEIADVFSSCMQALMQRERLALGVEHNDYIRKLCDLFRMCEDLEDVEGLHRLFDIFKMLFLLNSAALYDVLFSDDVILSAVGALEYDPSKIDPVRHRDYLKSTATFRKVVPISKPEVVAKIHQTYKYQYVHDAVLPTPTVFEENVLSSLGALIFFNKAEIATQLQEDEDFMRDLFDRLNDQTTPMDKAKDLLLLLKDLCSYSQALKIPERIAFLKTVSSRGLVSSLGYYLRHSHSAEIELICLDIVSQIAEFNATVIRDVVVGDPTIDEDDIFFNVIISKMVEQKESGNAIQYLGLLRTLIDTDNMVTTTDRTEKGLVLSFFYKHCMHRLVSPLLVVTKSEAPTQDDYGHSVLLGYVLELLIHCVEKHTFHIKNYVISHNLLRRALVLLQSRHSHLCLSALRFCRRIVGLKDEFYNRYIVQSNLLDPVIAAFLKNGSRYNLVNSAIIELFEFMTTENVITLISHVVKRHMDSLRSVSYVNTFNRLHLRYEQEQDRQMGRAGEMNAFARESVPNPVSRTIRRRRDPREVDMEEEAYFFNEDDEDDAVESAATTVSQIGPPQLPPAKLYRKFAGKFSAASGGGAGDGAGAGESKSQGRIIPRMKKRASMKIKSSMPARSERPSSPPLVVKPIKRSAIKFKPIVGLVDYPDEDSDSDEEGSSRPQDSPSKKAKLDV